MILNEEDKVFLTELANKMVTQDRRGTADPYYYTVMVDSYVASYEGNDGDRQFYYSDELLEQYDSIDEAKEDWDERGYEKEDIEKMADNLREIHEDLKHEYKGYFLTKEACERHIEQNKHNYNNPKSYVGYEHRNPEMERLYKIIKSFATIEDPEKKGNNNE